MFNLLYYLLVLICAYCVNRIVYHFQQNLMLGCGPECFRFVA